MKSRGLCKIEKPDFLVILTFKNKTKYLFVHKTSALASNINFGITLSRRADRCILYIKAYCPHSPFLVNVKTM